MLSVTRGAPFGDPALSRLGDPRRTTRCEALYRAPSLRPFHKMTSACTPSTDARLDERGYAFDAHTSVQLLESQEHRPGQPRQPGAQVQPDKEWQSPLAHAPLKAKPRANTRATRADPAPDLIHRPGGGRQIARVVGCAAGRLSGIFTSLRRTQRRRGYSGSRCRACCLGPQHGAQTPTCSHAQQSPALAQYAGLGFREIYCYWYR